MADFDLDNFKDWMDKQQEKDFFSQDESILRVRPKINRRRLIEKITVDHGDAEQLMKEFRHGGTVVDKEGKNYLIEVESGTFIIPTHYCKEV